MGRRAQVRGSPYPCVIALRAGGPPKTYTFVTPESVEEMQANIAALRAPVGVLAVSLHKGLVHTPARLAMYTMPSSGSPPKPI